MSDAIESSVAIDKIIELAEQSIKFHQSLPPRPIFTSPPRGLQLSNEPVTPEAAQSGSNISSNPLDNIETTAPQHFPLASSTPRQNIGNISPPQPSTSSTIASPQNPVDTTMPPPGRITRSSSRSSTSSQASSSSQTSSSTTRSRDRRYLNSRRSTSSDIDSDETIDYSDISPSPTQSIPIPRSPVSQAIAPATQAPATVSASTAAPSVIEDDDVILIPENIPFINLCDSPFSQPLQAFNDNSQMNQSGILECLVLQGPNENRPLIPVSRQERRARQSRLTFRPVPDIIIHSPPPSSPPAITAPRNSPKKQVNNDLSQRGGGIDCPICFEGLKGKVASSTICGHIFCAECIETAMTNKKRCPICTKTLKNNQVHRVFLPGH